MAIILAPDVELMYYCSSPKYTAECTKLHFKVDKMFQDHEVGRWSIRRTNNNIPMQPMRKCSTT